MSAPGATYRLQLSPGFGFHEASQIVPHLAQLGITHLYLSPIFEAVPGSTHGYDVTDPLAIRHELGGVAGFDELCRTCDVASLGIILDIVPNHISASHHNRWWYDVLKHGRNSRFAGFFDIDWNGPAGAVVNLPVLGQNLDDVLQSRELSIQDSAKGPEFAYFEHRFPLSDASAILIGGASATPSDLRDLLELQHYRLLYWRDGLRVLNYRRFLDMPELVAIRNEEPSVFDAYHALIVDLVKVRKVAGLRIDHIDGLPDPGRYLARLRAAVHPETPHVFVEKLVGDNEQLPGGWAASGTTGYEWLNRLNGVFVEPDGFGVLAKFREEFTGDESDFQATTYESKLRVIAEPMSAELTRLTTAAVRLANPLGEGRVLADDVRAIITALTAASDTYRSDAGDERGTKTGAGFAIEQLSDAASNASEGRRTAARLLKRILTLDVPHDLTASAKDFLGRWEPFSGAVMSKAVEDTAFYRYTVLGSMNEVGGAPEAERASVERFHSVNRSNASRRHRPLLATSTHDSKWSEDARSRINVISEMAAVWGDHVKEWTRLNGPLTSSVYSMRCPSPNSELLFYQALVAILPPGNKISAFAEVADRVTDFMIKAAREAKLETSWLEPSKGYEDGLRRYVRGVLVTPEGDEFRSSFSVPAAVVAFHGAVNSLGQVVLKVGSPGVPDFYQGCEVWNLNLVDPDNRRSVHWSSLTKRLSELTSIQKDDWANTARESYLNWTDGRIKQWVTWRALSLRSERPTLFSEGTYAPLDADGPMSESVCAFERRSEGSRAVAIATRMSIRAGATPEAVTSREPWSQTIVRLPDAGDRRFEDVLTGRPLVAKSGRLEATDVFEVLPVAMLVELSD